VLHGSSLCSTPAVHGSKNKQLYTAVSPHQLNLDINIGNSSTAAEQQQVPTVTVGKLQAYMHPPT
jgi:hypothetical protein